MPLALAFLATACVGGADGESAPVGKDSVIFDSPTETDTDSGVPLDTGSHSDSDTGQPTEDVDGDGQTTSEGDCNDRNADVYRGATDTDGDGVDSNCDGIDSSRAVLVESVSSAHLLGDSNSGGLGNTAGLKLIVSPDATGDGLSDVYVGGPTYFYDPEGPDRPSAMVWLASGLAQGSEALTDVAASSWSSGEEWGADFGETMDNAGDVDGDGLADAIVGAYMRTLEDGEQGSAFGFSGGLQPPGGLADATFELQGVGSQSFLGLDVIGAVDVDHDGVTDIIADAVGSAWVSKTLIFLGPRSGIIHESDADQELDGRAFSYTGADADINADGVDDLLVWVDDELRVVSPPFVGSDPGIGIATIVPSAGQVSLSTGDVNGDGQTDLAFGSEAYDSAGANSGRVGFFLGPLGGTKDFSEADAFLDAERSDVGLSRGLSIAGDLDGDGDDEIVVGAPGVYAERVGAVVIFRDLWTGTLTTAAADLVIDGPELYDCFGWSLGTEGDLDGDGLDDVVIGAPYDADWAGSVSLIPASSLLPLLP